MMKTNLPINQISESQRRSSELSIEPHTKGMQADFGGQTSSKPAHIMRPFTGQAKGVEQFVIDRFDDLSQTRPSSVVGLWASETAVLQKSGGTEKNVKISSFSV
jgi:hypothetical protein